MFKEHESLVIILEIIKEGLNESRDPDNRQSLPEQTHFTTSLKYCKGEFKNFIMQQLKRSNKRVPFIQISALYEERLSNELHGSEYKVMQKLYFRICKSKRGRIQLRGEFACRYLARLVKISASRTAEILQILVKKGFLKIIEKGKSGFGTIYKLLFEPGEVIPLKISKKSSNNCCPAGRTSTNSTNIVSNDLSDFNNKSIKKAINLGINILNKKKINPTPVIERLLSYLKFNRAQIQNPAGYLIGACKREVKPVEPVSVEKTRFLIEKQQREEKEILHCQEDEKRENYLAGMELLRGTYPGILKNLEKQLWKEQGIKWNFMLKEKKAELVVKRFLEKYGTEE